MKKAGILGATGAAGLEFIRALVRHPWFGISELYASDKSAGKTFGEACLLDISDIPGEIRDMPVKGIDMINGMDVIFSALPSEVARDVEGRCAEKYPVLSTSSAYRYDADVPILLTEINANHHRVVYQQWKRNWNGWVIPGPNCTTVGLAMSLYPLYRTVGIEKVVMSSYQSVSGGGASLIQKWAEQKKEGLPAPLQLDAPLACPTPIIEGNVIGFIENEEEKVKKEACKILGEYREKQLFPASFSLACSCVRVPTLYGHFETVFVETKKNCTEKDVKDIYATCNDEWKKEYGMLPSSPKKTIHVLERTPQPYYDAFVDKGMATIIGRIEKTNEKCIKYHVLSNNVVKGAAKGMVQVAEYLHRIGML